MGYGYISSVKRVPSDITDLLSELRKVLIALKDLHQPEPGLTISNAAEVKQRDQILSGVPRGAKGATGGAETQGGAERRAGQ